MFIMLLLLPSLCLSLSLFMWPAFSPSLFVSVSLFVFEMGFCLQYIVIIHFPNTFVFGNALHSLFILR